jgi:LysM repeat protein
MRRWLVLVLVFAFSLWVAAAQEAEVTTVTFPPLNLAAGESLDYQITINCLADGCSVFDITLSFDPTLLQVDDVEAGAYMGESVLEVENEIDNEAGTLHLAVAVLGDLPETDDDVLMHIQITALESGEGAFTVTHLDLGDLLGNPIEVEVIDGEAEATPTVEPSVTPTAAVSAVMCEYTVKAGDTLNGIAIANSVSLEDIMTLNNIADARFIYVGQKLEIPSTTCVAGLSAGGGNNSGGGRPNGTQYFAVWDCRHLGSNVFEWYGVEVSYNAAGSPIGERRVDGPHTGDWQAGCPAGAQSPGGQGGGGDDDDSGSSGGGGEPPPV